MFLLLKTISGQAQCINCPQYLDGQTGNISWVNGPTPWQEYCLTNNVTITGNISITGCKVKIAPNVIIRVQNGANLIITGSHFYACSEMWNGIIVEPGGRLIINGIYISGTPSGPIQTSLIEDAKIAVHVLDNPLLVNPYFSMSLPFLAREVVFNKNRIGVKLENFNMNITNYVTWGMTPFTGCLFTSRDITSYPFVPGTNPPGINWPNLWDIKAGTGLLTDAPYINSVLYPPTTLESPYAGENPSIGFCLENNGTTTLNPSGPATYEETKIGYLYPWHSQEQIIFDNHLVGISALNSNVTVTNCVFQNLINTGLGSGIGILVESTGTNNNRLRVMSDDGTNNTGNTFFNCSRAIESKNYLENIISRNSFNSTQTTPGINHLGRHGVVASSNRYQDFIIEKNHFKNIAFPVKFSVTSGPFDVGNGMQNGVYAGRIVIDNNKFSKYLVANSPTDWLYTAIQLDNNPFFSIQGSPIGGPDARINFNRIKNAYNGIRTQGFNTRLEIKDNRIQLFEGPGNNPQDGIWSRNNTSLRTVGNIITGFDLAVQEIFAIRSLYCTNQFLECNEMENTYFGASFYGNCSNSTILRNKFTQHRRGLSLHQNGIIGIQGNSTSPSDNYWDGFWPFNPSGTTSNYKTSIEGFPSTMGSSYLWVRSSSPGFNPNNSCYTISGYDFSVPTTMGYVSNPSPPSSCLTGYVKSDGENKIYGEDKNKTDPTPSKEHHVSNVNISIYPNPCESGVFTTQVSDPKKDILTKIVVLTPEGVTVYKTESNSAETYIDISDQPSGLYFVRITHGKSLTLIKRIFIN